MKYSLRSKLSVTYVLVALICVFLITIFTNVFLDKQFKEYVKKNQETKNNEIVNLVSHQYTLKEKWDSHTVENVGVNALENGMIIKVKDINGLMIWDATLHNSGMCNQMLAHYAQNMSDHYPNWHGGYVENKFQIYYNLKVVGSIDIGYYGPYYYSDNDLTFINTLNKLLIVVGIFSLLFALLLGALMAKRISTPISKAVSSAQMLAKGYYGDRVSVKSNTKEIHLLTTTINDLGETLEKQELLRKRMSQDVAHELRTPLATLQSHMEAMIDGIWKPDIERLSSCHDEILRINRMVGDLEKLSKYESENLNLDKTKFDIVELTTRIIKNFESDFIKKGLKVEISGGEEEVFADKDKISQVLINLLSNAIKYTPAGGSIEVKIKGAEDITEISIKDTGKGIPDEDLKFIFERFYRADKSRNRSTGGSGIGLTIAKAIVDAHKGRIIVQSTLDVGTEFIVSLPKK